MNNGAGQDIDGRPFRDEASTLEGQVDSQGAAKNLKGVDLAEWLA